MALDLRQNLKLTQQLLMTPQLQQAIKLLQLSRLELEQFVTQQLAENPVLEESLEASPEEEIYSEREQEATTDEVVSKQLEELSSTFEENSGTSDESAAVQEVDWESLSRLKESSLNGQPTKSRRDDEGFNYENIVSGATSVASHLLQQIGELDFSEEELQISQYLVGSINDRGYFEGDLDEIAREEGADIELVEGVLDAIQRLDPPGVGARDLRECLLLQLRESRQNNGIVEKIVQDHMKLLETRNFNAIAKAMKISLADVIQNVAVIATLEPVPARSFGGDVAQPIVPDVYVFKMAGKWVVSLNEDGLPPLKLSEFYSDFKQVGSSKDKEYVNEKVKAAQWLIKSIQQRQRTIFKVTQCIVARQTDFFEKGVQFLKPMILKDIADDIGMHESTISRVTTNKYVHTPRGLLELKYFFNNAVMKTEGGGVASEAVKVSIKELVEAENSRQPLSDQKIVKLLEEQGIQLARRTVAKYREQLGILPSSKRKRYF